MADLYVRSEVLDSLRTELATISNRLEGACNAVRRLDAEAVGAPPLIDAVDNFAESWHYGITQIGQRTEASVQALAKIGQAFDECDSMLGQALQGNWGGAGGRA